MISILTGGNAGIIGESKVSNKSVIVKSQIVIIKLMVKDAGSTSRCAHHQSNAVDVTPAEGVSNID